MKFKELSRLSQDQTGGIPREIIDRLSLPLPEDVLEQFVFDHGTKWEFQDQFGDFDLHGVQWTAEKRTAKELIACSVYERFLDYFEGKAEQTAAVLKKGWGNVALTPKDKKEWQEKGTWSRSPLFLERNGPEGPMLFLIEGHTRTGALKGLVRGGFLPADGLHEVWIGRSISPSEVKDDGAWRAVLIEERVPFSDWFMRLKDNDSPTERLGDKVLSASCDGKLHGDGLDAVLTYFRTVGPKGLPKGLTMKEAERLIREAYDRWENWTMA